MGEPNNFDATGSFAGYLFQCRLALLRALQVAKQRSNAKISIEKFDDIAFEHEDYASCLIQAKHHIVRKSLSDKSVDVWKTIRIWIAHTRSEGTSNSAVQFFLITNACAKAGEAMSYLRVGRAKEDEAKALSLLDAAAEESSNKETDSARAEYLSLSELEKKTLLARIEVIDNHSSLIDMRDELEGELIIAAPSHTSKIADYLEGWWFGQVAEKLMADHNKAIPVQNVIMKANEFGRMFGPDALPIGDTDKLLPGEIGDVDEGKTFVRQMRLVNAPDRAVNRGVLDYYKASVQRSIWARENLLLDGESSRYDDRLRDKWERKSEEEYALGDVETNEGKEAVGLKLLLWAMQQSVSFRTVVETWITSGSFQVLSDLKRIGWHPDFESLLEGGDEDENA